MEKGLVHLETDQSRGDGARDVLPTPFIKNKITPIEPNSLIGVGVLGGITCPQL